MRSDGGAGPPGRVFYVSPDSVYVWVSDWSSREAQSRPSSMLYRMPLDGSGPSALGVSGSPVDQFSFLESEDRHLNVLVRSDADGDGMWAAEVAAGDVALLRVPLASFRTAATRLRHPATAAAEAGGLHFPESLRRRLPAVRHGQRLGPAGEAKRPSLYAVPWAGGARASFRCARRGPHRGDGCRRGRRRS